MIYDENRKTDHLSPALFQNPTSEYRGTPFWAWNCELDREELLRQIDVFREMGLGGFHMHVRTGMSTPYLSEEFMDLIRACTDHAKAQGMLAWLYDEDRWPSGAAGGYVTKEKAYRQRYLLFTTNPQAEDEVTDPVLLRCFDVVLDEQKTLASYRIWQAGEPVEGTLWYVYRKLSTPDPWYNDQTYLDTLNPKAVAEFIKTTHDRYYRAIGSEFSKTIPAIFTDEPQFSRKETLAFADSKQEVCLPWTDDLEQTYQKAYGESLLDHLPQLLWDLPKGAPSLTRYRYHDHVCDRFTEAFADQCGNWCEKHNLMLTGHMMEEDNLRTQTAALGEAMRSYRSFQLPGIDMLCARWELMTAKQTQSAVHQYGRAGMMSELYGVTDWDFDFRDHKLHGDWQAALGVTVRVPHLSWVAMQGEAKRDYPASISYQSPYYKEYRYIEDHFARVNTALTRGKPLVRVGVIHPVESYWLHWGPQEQTQLIRSQLDENFRNVTNWLLRGSIDFDFISESLLPSLCKIGGNPLQVGEMAYDAIVVPGCETLRSTTVERLQAFRNRGGKLIFLGDAPKFVDAKPDPCAKALYLRGEAIAFQRAALLYALEEYRTVELRNASGGYTENLFHQLRRDKDGMWLFLAHGEAPISKNVPIRQQIKLTVKGRSTPIRYNTQTGETEALPFTYENGNTVLFVTLYEQDSLLLFFRDGVGEAKEALPAFAALPLPQVEATVPYSLSEPNVLLLDMAQVSLDGGDFAPEEEILRADNALRRTLGLPLRQANVTQPWTIANKETAHTVTVRYAIESEIDVAAPMLALEDADVATVVWNGATVEKQDKGYYIDRCIRKIALPSLKQGKNLLEITLPFGERTNLEACYLLGDFGVRLQGRYRSIVALPSKLGFGDITDQGLPYYGGELIYHLTVTAPKPGKLTVHAPHYRASVLRAKVAGQPGEVLAYSPYTVTAGEVQVGENRVELIAYISRRNCLSPVHQANETLDWIGPNAWRTEGDAWTYEYRLKPSGILSTPILALTEA